MEKLLNRRFKNIGMAIIVAVLVLILWAAVLKPLLNNIEIMTYDWRAAIGVDKGPFNSKFSHADKNIVLLSADDYSFQTLSKYPELGVGRWPWQREVWGDVVDYIAKGKPKAIVFDVKFEGKEGILKDNIESDRYFSKVVGQNKNTVLGVALSYPRLKISDSIEKIQNQQNLPTDMLDSLINDELKLKNLPLSSKLSFDVNDDLILDNNYKKTLIDNITFFGYSSIYDELLKNTMNIGVINLKSGENMVARYHVPLYRLVSTGSIAYIPSLSLSTVLSIIPDKEKQPFSIDKDKISIGERVIPIDNQGNILFNWHGVGGTYKSIPVARVLLSNALHKGEIKDIAKEDIISPAYFKDKIIVIGQTAAGTDIHSTPMGMVYPGPEIIATAIDNLLNDSIKTNPTARKFVVKAPFVVDLVILLIFCTAVGVFNIRSGSTVLSLTWGLLMVFLFILFATVIFTYPGLRIWVNMTYPVIFMTLTAIGAYSYKIYMEQKEKKVVENLFGKFVSPQVLDKLLTDPKSINREGQRKVMTVMFSDIRGFTTISESIPVQELILQLNEYLTEMVEVVLSNNGTMDKYIGDAVMAFFGDPLPMSDHAFHAVKTALDMKTALAKLNENWEKENKPVLSIGIGINTGEMIVGHLGSPRLFDYTVIGDNVNLASRLEGLNKDYKTTIIISEATYIDVQEQVEAIYLGEVKVKGKQNAVKIYEIKGLK